MRLLLLPILIFSLMSCGIKKELAEANQSNKMLRERVKELELNNTKQREFLSRKIYGNLNQLNAWVFVDETVYLNPKLTLNLGLRTDIYRFAYTDFLYPINSGITYKAITNPKVNLEYQYNSNVKLSAKSGFGFHSNDARSVVLGRLENSLARAFGNEAGVYAKLTSKTFFNLAFWTLDLENELVYVGDEGVVEVAGATRRYGIDFGVRQQIAKHWFVDLDINVNGKPIKVHMFGFKLKMLKIK